MRLTLAAASLAAAAALTLGGAAPALAATSLDPGTAASSTTTGTGSSTTVTEPGHLMLGSSTVRPGATITFSGTCPTQSGPGFPTIGSVTSPVFSGSTITKDDPYAFTGTATVSADAAPGTYTVTAHCSNGSATATITVVGSHVTPSGGGTHGSGHSGSGAVSAARTSGSDGVSGVAGTDGSSALDLVSEESTPVLPLVLGGLAVAAVAGGGAYALGRGRAADRVREQAADARTERMPLGR